MIDKTPGDIAVHGFVAALPVTTVDVDDYRAIAAPAREKIQLLALAITIGDIDPGAGALRAGRRCVWLCV